MAPQIVHLPDGQTFTVTPVFAGVGFRSHELNAHRHPFPVGWTTVLQTERPRAPAFRRSWARRARLRGEATRHARGEAEPEEHEGSPDDAEEDDAEDGPALARMRPFTAPTLRNDTLFISSISNPSNADFKAPASPTRQIAMMLWVTLYWYFHQPEPSARVTSAASAATPDAAKPTADWRIYIKRDGVLRGRNLVPKLERMGLIAAEDTAVGTSLDDDGGAWASMFVSRRMFWQIPGRLFLFSPKPSRGLPSSSSSESLSGSRPTSPQRCGSPTQLYRLSHPPSPLCRADLDLPGSPMPTTPTSVPSLPVGPFFSTSHLPTYYPPAPLQYVFTDGIRHPLRPKPPRMGEVFYSRFIPSVAQYLAFRVASSSHQPVPYFGPVGPKPPEHSYLLSMSDTALLERWYANPRIQEFWGAFAPDCLERALRLKHSFPVIGLWDGVPFGYFEIYWVKEDILGRHVGSEIDDWDRGVHIMIGEEWSRGKVALWMTGLLHWCLAADLRTMNVCLEPRVDNQRMLRHLDALCFVKELKLSFPHKEAWYVRFRREAWEGPAL